MEGFEAIEPGWDVYGSDDEKIGSVQEVDEHSISVEKGLLFVKDLYVPASAIGDVDEDEHRVKLNVTKDAVGDMGWTEPPLHRPGEDRETWGQGTLELPDEHSAPTRPVEREAVIEDTESPDVKPGSTTEQLY